MDYFSKKRALFWTIIGLLMVNIISLGSIWYFNMCKDHPFDRRKMGFHPPFQMERVLGLSDEQKQQFRESREKHRGLSKPIHTKVMGLKKELMLEIFKDEPDAEREDLLTKEILIQKGQFEKLTHEHFKELKTFCTEEQTVKLKKTLLRLVDFMGSHKGRKRRGDHFRTEKFEKDSPPSFQKHGERGGHPFSEDE